MSNEPPSDYAIGASLSGYLSSPPAFLAANPDINAIMAGALVTNPAGQVLLLRRAPTDSWPLKWEIPGGCVDPTDAHFVAAASRELWEEAGLRATRAKVPVGVLLGDEDRYEDGTVEKLALPILGAREGDVQMDVKGDILLFRETGDTWGKLTVWFDVETCEGVEVRPDEHAEWAWVTEREARDKRFADGRELDFVSEGVRRTVLEGFRLWKQDNKESGLTNANGKA